MAKKFLWNKFLLFCIRKSIFLVKFNQTINSKQTRTTVRSRKNTYVIGKNKNQSALQTTNNVSRETTIIKTQNTTFHVKQ